MIKIRRPSDQKEYNRICKEWDSINEPESGKKSHWKGILIGIVAIGCVVGIGYALSQARKNVPESLKNFMYPYGTEMYGDDAMYLYGAEGYDDSMYPYDVEAYEEDYEINQGEAVVGENIYNYDSTYNGLEMSGFVSTIFHLLEKNGEHINEYVQCVNNKDATKVLDAWTDTLNEYEQKITSMAHHVSFDVAYQETMDLIIYCKELINLPEMIQNETLKTMDVKTNSIVEHICEAFDKNSIRYTKLENGGIKFWYEKR